MLTLFATIAATAFVAESEVDEWAQWLLKQAEVAPSLAAAHHQIESAELGASAALELQPWQVSTQAQVDRTAQADRMPGFLSAEETLVLGTRAAKYLGFGGDLDAGLTYSLVNYYREQGLDDRPSHSIRPELRLSVDVLRNRGGRLVDAQLRGSHLSSLAGVWSGRDTLQAEGLRMLQTALDYCVLVRQQAITDEQIELIREAQRLTEARVKAELADEADALQIATRVEGMRNQVVTQDEQASQLTIVLTNEFGVELRPEACPPLIANGARLERTPQPSIDDVFAIRAAELQVRSRVASVEQTELTLLPTLAPFVAVFGTADGRRIERIGRKVVSQIDQWGATVGVNLVWEPANTVGQLSLQSQQVSLAASRKDTDALIARTRARLAQLTLRLDTIERLIPIVLKEIDISSRYLEKERKRYKVGQTTALNLTNAYQTLLQSQSSEPPLVADWHRVQFEIRALIGNLVVSTAK